MRSQVLFQVFNGTVRESLWRNYFSKYGKSPDQIKSFLWLESAVSKITSS